MKLPSPDQILPIEAHGTLRLDAPTGRSIDLVADGSILQLELPGWAEARNLMPRSFKARAKAVRSVAQVLQTYGLTFSLQTAGASLCTLGHGVRPTWFARLLGLAPAHIPLSAIRLLLRRR